MLTGDGVRLRAVERDDLPLFVGWFNDPEVTVNLGTFLPLSKAHEDAWFAKALEGPREEFPLAIEAAFGESWRTVGSCGLYRIDWRNRSAGLGISIGDRGSWGQGIGTRAVRILLDHGFGSLNLHRIWLQVFAENERAVRCYEQVGFAHEGRFRQSEHRGGRYRDTLVMSVLRPEWEARRRRDES